MDAGMNWEGFKSISVAEAMDHTLGLYEYVIKETIRLNSKYKLQRVMAILQRAEKIDFYGNSPQRLRIGQKCGTLFSEMNLFFLREVSIP